MGAIPGSLYTVRVSQQRTIKIERFEMTVIIGAFCSDCGFTTKHPTRTRAITSLAAHETETGHVDQVYSTPADGWVRFRTVDLANANLGHRP